MSTQPTSSASAAGLNDYWFARRDKLFVASCIALIVTAMSFAIRGALIAPLGKQFNIDNEHMGIIAGTAFWGFALATIIGGPLCDVIGMGRILTLAFIGHAIGIFTTITANGYTSLYLGTLAFGLANGCVEAACNPLIATLYPDEKIKRLSLFHAWFPGGQVIGGLVAYAIIKSGVGGEAHGWQLQMASMILPLLIYGFLFMGKKFPATERAASGVSTGAMFQECVNPLFLIFVACMVLTAATELVTSQWLPNILGATLGVGGDSILFLVWITGLMAAGRLSAGQFIHRLSPIAMLVGSSLFSALGIYLLMTATSAVLAGIAATLFAAGVCFFWPTMLGVVSERFPKTGALGMSVMGGVGMLSTAIFLPIVGHRYDAGIQQALPPGANAEALKTAAAGTTRQRSGCKHRRKAGGQG